MRAGGRPAPFQVTGSRTASPPTCRWSPRPSRSRPTSSTSSTATGSTSSTSRRSGVTSRSPSWLRTFSCPASSPLLPAAATSFFDELVTAGHEGVVVKSAGSPYAAGRRGSGWVKVKPTHTLDLVVLAVEWGSGRRRGFLSNIHLGARDPRTGGFVMVGKTFKGMTDEMLPWQTERFTDLAVGGTEGWAVEVRPEKVVEVAIDGVQTSSRHRPGGIALRRTSPALLRRQAARGGRHDRHPGRAGRPPRRVTRHDG